MEQTSLKMLEWPILGTSEKDWPTIESGNLLHAKGSKIFNPCLSVNEEKWVVTFKNRPHTKKLKNPSLGEWLYTAKVLSNQAVASSDLAPADHLLKDSDEDPIKKVMRSSEEEQKISSICEKSENVDPDTLKEISFIIPNHNGVKKSQQQNKTEVTNRFAHLKKEPAPSPPPCKTSN